MKVLIPCLCGKPAEFEYEKNMDFNDSIAEDILNGNFMSATCQNCGKTLKPDFSVRFKNESDNIDILYIPEKDRDEYLRGKSQYEYKKPNRAVIGYGELVEKIRIIQTGLDDMAVESVKYYILSKIENDNNIENEVFIYFNRIQDDKLFFEIHGLHKDEIGFLPIERHFYDMNSEKLEENMEVEPFKTFLKPPYVSLLKVYREYEDNDPGTAVDSAFTPKD